MADTKSLTPLSVKLGYKRAMKVLLVNEPKDYRRWLNSLPDGITFLKSSIKPESDLIHAFFTEAEELRKEFPHLQQLLKPGGYLWISWKKGASGEKTDLNENLIREIGLPLGLVDVKVCAVNEVWSGLKFMYRTKKD